MKGAGLESLLLFSCVSATLLCLGLWAKQKNKGQDKDKQKRSITTAAGSTVDSKIVSSSQSQGSGSSPRISKKEVPKGKVIKGAEISEIRVHELESLRSNFPSHDIMLNDANGLQPFEYHQVLGEEDYILNDIVRGRGNKTKCFSEAFVRAGPRSSTHFNPRNVRAAIVTCGGLCPGLNNVIRDIVHALVYLYHVPHILGVVGGYNGFSGKPGYDPIELTVDFVKDCHHQGGTILASSRGGFDLDIILDFLTKHRIDQLFVIGGDGTHRGASALSAACVDRKLNISIVGIPKTIDNDVDLIDRSFGFTTSVEAAQFAITSAKTEARCNLPNGIGIVKLMGRSAGFIAAHATLASGDVDLCLVPENSIVLEGEEGCLPFLLERVKQNKHAVVVVAEGAGEELLGRSAEVDQGGNRKLPEIGPFLKSKIVEYFKKHDMEATVKYIDPSYMIRSIPANASDSLYCMLLAQNAVHGAMAGFTSFSVGLVNNRIVFIPIKRLVATSPRMMDPKGRTWERILAMTRQPQTLPTVSEEQSLSGRTI